MALILNINFDGYVDSACCGVRYGTQQEFDGFSFLSCDVSIPASSSLSEENARLVFTNLASQFTTDFSSEKIVILAVSESCGVLAGLYRFAYNKPLNLVSISSCYDRNRTPFSHVYSCPLDHNCNCSYKWFDWRSIVSGADNRLLVLHASLDPNFSTPFNDAYSFFLRRLLLDEDVTLLQVPGMGHGVSLLDSQIARDYFTSWIEKGE